MLAIENIEVVYDHVFLAIKGISLEVAEGGAVALLGANGAGKSTTLKAVSGLLAPERGEVTRGELRLRGKDLVALCRARACSSRHRASARGAACVRPHDATRKSDRRHLHAQEPRPS